MHQPRTNYDIFLKLWIGVATNFHAWSILLAFIPKENKKQTNLDTVHFTDWPFAVAFPIQAETGYPGQKQDSLYPATYWSMPSHVRFQLSTYSLALKESLSSGIFGGRTSTWSRLLAILGSQGISKGRRPHFRLTCVAQKRLCLSSLIFQQIGCTDDSLLTDTSVKQTPRVGSCLCLFSLFDSL